MGKSLKGRPKKKDASRSYVPYPQLQKTIQKRKDDEVNSRNDVGL